MDVTWGRADSQMSSIDDRESGRQADYAGIPSLLILRMQNICGQATQFSQDQSVKHRLRAYYGYIEVGAHTYMHISARLSSNAYTLNAKIFIQK